MKKILTLFFVFALKGSFAQLCPCGGTISLSIEKFNFHRPKKNCLEDFGLCLKLGKLTIQCSPCDGPRPVARMEGDMVNGYLLANCGELTLHLPAGLIDDKIFEGQKTDYFEIEDGAIDLSQDEMKPAYTVKGGIYPVHIINDELVIPISFY